MTGAAHSKHDAPGPGGAAGDDDGSRPASKSELEILRNPDHSTTWTGVAVVHLAERSVRDPAGSLLATLDERLPVLGQGMPVSCARLSGTRWVPGPPTVPSLSTDGDPTPASMLARFELSREPPLRILVAPDGEWASFFVHHAAFDGAALFAAVKVLLCGADPPRPQPTPAGNAEIPWSVLSRILHPADPVAPSEDPPTSDTFVYRDLPRIGRGVTAALPQACVSAVAQFSASRGRPLRRVGISLGLSRSEGHVNHSTFRRVDVRLGDPLAPAIKRALADPDDPWQIRHPTRLLRLATPLVGRLSDTIVFTHVGRLSMPGVRLLEGYPVARGRSAVAFCALRVAGAGSTLTMRARDINRADANRIIEDALAALAG